MKTKIRTQYRCKECAYQSPSWLGKCPSCEAWNSFEEEQLQKTHHSSGSQFSTRRKLVHIDDASLKRKDTTPEYRSNIPEIARVIGSGLPRGSLNLLFGEPGIGKSTFVLSLIESLAPSPKKIIYVCAEESEEQVAKRIFRLGLNLPNLYLVHMQDIEGILEIIRDEDPSLVIIDSLQVIRASTLPQVSGSVTQVRTCLEALLYAAKTADVTFLIIGQVTKEGELAGPRTLEHMVDTVFTIEGERDQSLRVFRAIKNRFHNTEEIGVFEMTKAGLTGYQPDAMSNVSLSKPHIGSSFTILEEGSRMMLREIQSLVAYTQGSNPKRQALGIDYGRLPILVAILSRHIKIRLDAYDVYCSLIGGLKTKDIGADLSIAASILSSKFQKTLPPNTIFLGELGLNGEVKQVANIDKRLKYAFERGIVSACVPKEQKKNAPDGLKTTAISHITELLNLFSK